MSSSPTLSADAKPLRHEPLLSVMATVPDPRDARGVRYPLPGTLALSVSAVIAGSCSFAAIGQWTGDAGAEQLAAFGLTRASAPDESTLRKLFAGLDADALDAAVGRWMFTRTGVVDGRRVIALDGKTVRGARTRPDGKAPHLIAAFDHDAGAVLGQVTVDAKSNEIPAARTLLATFDLNGVVVTMDAMHTQTDTAELITDRGADYVFTAKRNMPTLHRQLKDLPWKHVPATRQVTVGRGQRVTRTIKVLQAPTRSSFPTPPRSRSCAAPWSTRTTSVTSRSST